MRKPNLLRFITLTLIILVAYPAHPDTPHPDKQQTPKIQSDTTLPPLNTPRLNPAPFSPALDHTEMVVKVAAPEILLIHFEQVIQNRACYEVQNIKELAETYSLDLLVLCRALYLGGIKPQFQFIVTGSYLASLNRLTKGEVHTSSQTKWISDIQPEKFLASQAAMEKGTFEKGIFVLKGNPLLKQPPETIEFDKHRGISVLHWRSDLDVLRQITPNVFSAINYESVFTALKKGQADYTIMNIQNEPPFEVTPYGHTLYPIEGIKVVFTESRHFAFSKRLPGSKTLQYATDKGLAIMKATGELDAILLGAGIKNPLAKDWKIINDFSIR